MAKLVTNTTQSNLTITDLNGVVIEPAETIDLNMFDKYLVFNSVSLVAHLASGDLLFNDGTNNVSPNEAINIIKDSKQSFLLDDSGRQYVVTTTRPLDTVLHYTSVGDTFVSPYNGTIGNGSNLHFTVAPGATTTKEIQFIEDIMFLGGKSLAYDAEPGSYGNAEIAVPAGMPYPAKNNNGNYDYTNGQWVQNQTNTGKYFISGTDTIIHRFVNQLPLGKYSTDVLQASEPSKVPSGYKIRVTIHNASTTADLHTSILLTIFRKTTV